MSAAAGTDLAWLGIVEASALIKSRKLSPVEYTQAQLTRIDRLDERLHAFIRTTPKRAMDAARAAEAEIMAGRWRGPLHGVPFALKDIIDVAGLPTTAHSKILIDNYRQGRLGRCRALECCRRYPLRQTRDARIRHRWSLVRPALAARRQSLGQQSFPGGSSSGSGVALAAGYVPAALGTDTGGSVRNPASMCAITGLKPTYGLVSRRGVFPLSYSLDHVGPMTRDVADNALLLQILAGHDPNDPASADVAIPDYSAGLGKGVKGLRIAHVRHLYDGDETAHPAMIKAIDGAARVLREMGAAVEEIRLPSFADYATCCRLIIRCEAYAIHRRWMRERPGDYGEICRWRMLDGAAVSAADYIDALRLRARLIAQTLDAMRGFDVALTASSLDPPMRIDDADAVQKAYPRQVRQPFNVTGQPAIAIPAGFARDAEGNDLPLSIQIIGHPFQEAMVYRVAHAYEQATRWIDRHPPGM